MTVTCTPILRCYLADDCLKERQGVNEITLNSTAAVFAFAGYQTGASQLCAQGYYSVGYHKLPCTKCPFGKTTTSNSTINDAEGDCNVYVPGYGDLTDIPQLCPVGTYSPVDTPLGTACTACPNKAFTTAEVGADEAADCSGMPCAYCGNQKWQLTAL